MGLFGGCGNNNDSWIWILVVIVLIFCCCDNGGCGIYLNSCSDVAVDGCLIHNNKGSALSSFNTTNLSYDGEKLVGDVDIG